MEVHAHSHTPRKKWTHYLWEFLMMFLAVFCGFLAENQREHLVEEHRAKEYAIELLEDLKRDTSGINTTIDDCNFIISCVDSLQNIADSSDISKDVPGTFYYYSRLVTASPSVDWHRAALNQIINSGNARYFKSTELLKKISFYDEIATLINSQHANDRVFRAKTMELRSRVLKSKYFNMVAGIVQGDYTSVPETFVKNRFPIQNNEPGLLNEYLNSCQNRKATLNLLRKRDLPESFATAVALIELLKKEYRLK
jgi:hypothetical protein